MDSNEMHREYQVSIIIPVYNCEIYLSKCLDSIVKQTHKNIEIIVVNDGSVDGSRQIIEWYQKRDCRIKIINQSNQGSTVARKKGMQNVDLNSRYFCFCDADDYVHEEYIDRLLEKAVVNNADIVSCHVMRFLGVIQMQNFTPNCLLKENIYRDEKIINELYHSYFGITDFPGYLPSKMFDAKLLNSILNLDDVVKFSADDLSVMLRILPLCKCIVTIPDYLYYYRYGGYSSKYLPNFMNDFMQYHKLQKAAIAKYSLPDSFRFYSSVELVNIFRTWMSMCLTSKKISMKEVENEFLKWNSTIEIQEAIASIGNQKIQNSEFLNAVNQKDFEMIKVQKSYNDFSWKTRARHIVIRVINTIDRKIEWIKFQGTKILKGIK